jgi:hypothetical protein
MTLDLDRLDAAVDRAITNQACVSVAPGEMRETLRLARIGRDVETPKVRALHQDDGA